MTFNGQNIEKGNDVKCTPFSSQTDISYGGNVFGHSGQFAITNPSSHPELESAAVTNFNPTEHDPSGVGYGRVDTWEYDQNHLAHTGPATVTGQGKSFKITGKLKAREDASKTVPFEFDATCT
jgi:Mycobacterium 19 kDa lipoprotein antigen